MGTGPQKKRRFFSALNPIFERAKQILTLPLTEKRGQKRGHQEMDSNESNDLYRPRIEKELPVLPDEIWVLILQKLPLAALGRMVRVSKTFLSISQENTLWRKKGEEIGMPVDFLASDKEVEISSKERLKQFLLECRRLQAVYPQPLLNAFESVEQLAALPPLEVAPENHGQYMSFIKSPEMVGHKMKRGQTDRPFLTFCVRVAGEDKVLVQTLFQRYLHSQSVWVAAGDRILPEGEVGPKAWDYLRRLIAGEPCGVLGFPEEREPLTHDGENKVSLYDQLPKCG